MHRRTIRPAAFVSFIALVPSIAFVALAASACAAPTLPMPVPPTPATPAEVLDVLTFNVFLRAPAWMFRDHHDRRVRDMPAALAGNDVVVLQEAFSHSHRDAILTALAAEYPHRTPVAGREGWIRADSGLMLLSRWPITATAAITFGDTCAGLDCLADKAAIYARIDKRGRTYHLVVAHTQDGLQHRDVREAQLRAVRALIDSRAIPPTEPVIVLGDLNVDRIGDPPGYGAMLGILGVVDPAAGGAGPIEATWDGELNPLVGSDSRERLDYVLLERDHAQPARALLQVMQLRSATGFLSDHFALHAHLVFAASGS